MKILCVGPLWRGSDAGGLFKAISREGCYIDVIDDYYYLSFNASALTTKIIQKLVRPLQIREFNKAITDSVRLFKPNVLFVYKGAYVVPETLEFAKKNNCILALFYPDVSMTAHGKYLPLDIPLYDVVFTTKTFGIKDLQKAFGVKNAIFIPHGFDPEIHRKLHISKADMDAFGCDVSFIGTYSPKKERLLSQFVREFTDIDLKIWGNQWYKATDEKLKKFIQNTEVLGDVYALAVQCSKINLGILSEQIEGASSGDLITSRTFLIPGCNGFLLHEKNEESVQYFQEDKEAVFYTDANDLVSKVKYYLSNEALRENIKDAGYRRALKDHSLDARARTVIDHLNGMV